MLDRLKKERESPPVVPLYDEAWALPTSFNFARDVIDVAAHHRFRRGLTAVDREGTIDREAFSDISRASLRWAQLLTELVPELGERVVISIDAGSLRMGAILGAMRCGLIPVPVSASEPPLERSERADTVDAALIVGTDPLPTEAATKRNDRGRRPAFLGVEEAVWKLMRPNIESFAPDVELTAPAIIVFTRGTGGRPKPVVHSHAATAVAAIPLEFWLGVRPGDVVYCGADVAPAAAVWNGMLGPWAAGAEILEISPEVEIDARIRLLERFAPTVIVQTPAEHLALLDELARSGRRLPRLRIAGSTGDRLDGALADRFSCELGAPLLDAYGTAETSTIIAQTIDGADPIGALGRAVDGLRMRTADEDGSVCEPGAAGQLVLDGHPPSLFLGYWPNHWNLAGELGDVDLRNEAWWVPTDDRFTTDSSGAFWLERTKPAKRATRRRKRVAPVVEERTPS